MEPIEENTTGKVDKKHERRDKHIYEDKPGRLIVRNLQYDIKQKHLQQTFSKFGNIIDVNVPLNSESSLNKGFGFVEFKTREEAHKAIEALNAKNYKGRMIAIDFALSKRQYGKKIDDIIEKNPIKVKKTKAVDASKSTNEEKDSNESDDDTSKAPKAEKVQKADRGDKTDKADSERKDKKTVKGKSDPADKNEKKRTQKNRKKYENDVREGLTLFVRNIDYNITENDLREFFEAYGPIHFVRLVKSRDNPDVHKGSAFVKFTETEPVDTLTQISDEYWNQEKHTVSKAKLADLESKLEIRGRRLVMFKAESKQDRFQKVEESKVKVDKRNLAMIRVGLVGTDDFIHGPVGDKDMENRVRLFREKQDAVKKNPNLFVSKTRMCVRNLDKRMNEKSLAEFCTSFTNDWKTTLSGEERKDASQQKLVYQFKVLKDKGKTDQEGKPKNSGIGFIEVTNPFLAMYYINNMNNFIMNKKRPRGLIIDFALEDHRKLLKRNQKLESVQKKLKVAKLEEEGDKPKDEEKKREKKERNKITIDTVGMYIKILHLIRKY
jgi:nucleolar protein 4